MSLPEAACHAQSLGQTNQLFGMLVQTLLAAQCALSPPDKWPKDYGPTAIEQGLEEYDFIIVGAGSAGSVLANRLTENPDWKVLLLEAGGDPPLESEIPYLWTTLQKTAYDWQYYAQPNKKVSKSIPAGSFWPRGKMLGGSGAMNAMVYLRGNRRDFDQWEMLGNPGWGWQNVLEYFKKSEDNQQPEVLNSGNGRFHGQGGLLKVSTFKTKHSVDQLVLDAVQEIGFKNVVDFNGEEYIGYSLTQNTIDSVQGLRCSPATAFLASAANRTNLHVFKNAHVTKLDFNIDGSVAGVNFMMNGQLNNLVVRARKEVILSAGAINTPLILMLSGIGPEKNFRKLGVPLVKNLPGVGKNLQDHVWCPLLFRFRNLNNTTPENTEDELQKYLANRSGLFSESGLSNLMGLVNTADPLNPYPDIQYHYFRIPANSPSMAALVQNYGYELSVVQSFLQANKDSDVLLAMVVLLNPKSYGKIKLMGSDPLQKPRIDAGYLYLPEDAATMIRGIRHQQKLLATRTFSMAGAELFPVVVPGCQAANILPDSDGYWECYARHMATTLYHPSGSAKMGPDTDRDAVVDSRLKVKGLPNLRVVDASIMPKIVSANTNAATIMIGEKAADFIKADWPSTAPRTEL